MKQGHTPFGYKIVNGKAVVDEKDSKILKKIYENYLNGKSLKNSAKDAGIDALHSSVSRMLLNKRYLGDDYYPQLIDNETYDRVVEEKKKRASALGRTDRVKPKEKVEIPQKFKMQKPTQKLSDPFANASYLYSLIESEG